MSDCREKCPAVLRVVEVKAPAIDADDSTFLQLLGKGRKERTIPLWAKTAQVLKAWFRKLGEHAPNIAFPSARGKPLSPDGVDYLGFFAQP